MLCSLEKVNDVLVFMGFFYLYKMNGFNVLKVYVM